MLSYDYLPLDHLFFLSDCHNQMLNFLIVGDKNLYGMVTGD